MHDRVAEVLARRAALDSGPGPAVVVSLLLHGALASAAVWAALHAPAPVPAKMVSIKFASSQTSAAMPAMTPAQAKPAAPKPKPKPETPRIEEPKPEPVKPVTTATAPPEKNTVPLSAFGRSTKKGSETPALPARTETAPPATGPATTDTTGGVPADIPLGGSGIAGLEGGDFPYTIYIEAMHRKIGSNWFRPQVPPGTTVIVYFRIHRDGSVTDAKIEKPSGNGTFDRAALSAVRSAHPLNPLPYKYNGSYLGVHLAFR
ncbi:MAG TPA: TonB family protein [Thermoanaerobaculia bacterium]